MKRFATAVCVVLGVASTQAQRFEVASVKVSARKSMDDGGGGLFTRPGEIQIMGSTLRRILPVAFDWRGNQAAVRFDFSRVPAPLLQQTFFDIHAKGTGHVPTMLRTLLEDRFGMKWHRETKQVPVYRLTVRRPGMLGPYLKPSAVNCQTLAYGSTAPNECGGGGKLRGDYPTHRSAGTSADLALMLQRFSSLPIIDATQLKGAYAWDFAMPWAMQGAGESERLLETSVAQQLGLTLTRTVGPWEFVVIDALSMPTPN